MHRDCWRHVAERLVMISRNDQYVAAVHGLDVHERNRLCVFVADGDFGSALNQVTEDAMSRGPGHVYLARRDVGIRMHHWCHGKKARRWRICGPKYSSVSGRWLMHYR